MGWSSFSPLKSRIQWTVPELLRFHINRCLFERKCGSPLIEFGGACVRWGLLLLFMLLFSPLEPVAWLIRILYSGLLRCIVGSAQVRGFCLPSRIFSLSPTCVALWFTPFFFPLSLQSCGAGGGSLLLLSSYKKVRVPVCIRRWCRWCLWWWSGWWIGALEDEAAMWWCHPGSRGGSWRAAWPRVWETNKKGEEGDGEKQENMAMHLKKKRRKRQNKGKNISALLFMVMIWNIRIKIKHKLPKHTQSN